MIAAAGQDLLYPLSLFCRNGGHPLPSAEVIEGEAMPQPYGRLLVHRGDMTSRLEEFHQGPIYLQVLHREHTAEAYRREVVLHIQGTGLPVEYGAIEINLEAFEGELRDLILAQHLPLGGLLNRFKIKYRSEPKAFIHLRQDAFMRKVFGTPDATEFYGRCNTLVGEDGTVIARIVEVLRPCDAR